MPTSQSSHLQVDTAIVVVVVVAVVKVVVGLVVFEIF